MKWLMAIGLMLCGVLCNGQTAVKQSADKPLFKKSIQLNYINPSKPAINLSAEKDESVVIKPYHLVQPDRLPVFCAFEKKLYQTFKIPILVRLDDRKYDFK